MEVRLAHPAGYGPNARIVARARELAAATGGRLASSAPTRREVVRGADVVYTDAWTSMGQEAEAEERRDAFAGYRVDDALLDAAGPDAVAMHCLPAHRGEEITSAVMDGPRSIIWEQSENRLHVQKALLVELLPDERQSRTEARRPAIHARGRPGRRRPRNGSLYETYKDALRRGHVAALRSKFDVAIAAYIEAAGIAPDRPLPHASIGGILLKMHRPSRRSRRRVRPGACSRSPRRSRSSGQGGRDGGAWPAHRGGDDPRPAR